MILSFCVIAGRCQITCDLMSSSPLSFESHMNSEPKLATMFQFFPVEVWELGINKVLNDEIRLCLDNTFFFCFFSISTYTLTLLSIKQLLHKRKRCNYKNKIEGKWKKRGEVRGEKGRIEKIDILSPFHNSY